MKRSATGSRAISNRRGISVYSGKIGQQIAGPEVTVIDQGDMPGERGSLHFDDEGTPTQQNVLIENGVLKGYMQDRQNAQLMAWSRQVMAAAKLMRTRPCRA